VKTRLLLGAVMAAALVGPATASAQDIGKAKVLSAIRVQDGQATLRVRYQCATGEHIWVSAKQTATGKKDKALKQEGSSQLAAAWWQSHRDYFRCDGGTHTSIFYIDTFEPGSKGHLRKGFAWVQFCITTGETEADSKLIVSKSGWVKVKRR
jgi:hypothetical protein